MQQNYLPSTYLIHDKHLAIVHLSHPFSHQVQYPTWCGNNEMNCGGKNQFTIMKLNTVAIKLHCILLCR